MEEDFKIPISTCEEGRHPRLCNAACMDADTRQCMPVAALRAGKSGKLVRIAGKPEMKKHLSEMGFVIGDTICIVNDVSGSTILDIKGSRIAIDRSLASKLYIIPE